MIEDFTEDESPHWGVAILWGCAMQGLEGLARDMKAKRESEIEKIKHEAERRKEERENFRKDYYSGIKEIVVLEDCYHAVEDKEMLRLQKWAKSQGLRFEITEDIDAVAQEIKDGKKETLFYLADDRHHVRGKIGMDTRFNFDDDWPSHVVVDPYSRGSGSKGWYQHKYFVRELEWIARAQGLDTWHFDLELQTAINGCLAKYTLPWKMMDHGAVVKLLRGDFRQAKNSKGVFEINTRGRNVLVLVGAQDATPVKRENQWEVLCAIKKKYGERIVIEGEWKSHRGRISFQKLVIDTEQFSVDWCGFTFSETIKD